jgi:hypothetical protein
MRWILLIALVACGRGVAPRPLPLAPPAEAAGLTITLTWDASVDLDLYVTDPAWSTVYYGRRDGHMGADARCLSEGPSARWERARWTQPPRGRYRVGVDFPESCRGEVEAAEFHLVVEVSGTRHEATGTAHRYERQPVAMEFVVP